VCYLITLTACDSVWVVARRSLLHSFFPILRYAAAIYKYVGMTSHSNFIIRFVAKRSTHVWRYRASFIYVRTFRAEAPFFFLYKALPCRLVPQPFTFTLRLICISSRTLTGYGPRLLKSQPFPHCVPSEIVFVHFDWVLPTSSSSPALVASHSSRHSIFVWATQFEPSHNRHSLFWPFFRTRELLGVPRIFHHSSSNSKTLRMLILSTFVIFVHRPC
jgi:hypothetical protein